MRLASWRADGLAGVDGGKGDSPLFWWTRSQRIRTAGELPFEVALLEARPAPLYQRIGREARRLEDLGLSRHRIARKLEVAEKTVAGAIAWHRSVSGRIEG